MLKFNIFYFIIITILIILISCCIVFQNNDLYSEIFIDSIQYNINLNNSKFFWPTPGFNTITSYFGKRVAPTSGASTYHLGIDIASSAGSNVFSCIDGQVTYIGFNGSGRIYYYY